MTANTIPPEPFDDDEVPLDAVKVTEYEPRDPDREAIVDESDEVSATTDRGDLLEAPDDERSVDDFDDPEVL